METKVGQLVYKITAQYDDSFSSNIKKAETNVKELGKTAGKTEKDVKSFGDTMRGFAKTLGLVYLTKLVYDFGKSSVQAFANAQQSMIQFNNAQQNVAGTTKEQINDLEQYIQLLEEKTSIDDKSIRQAAQILAQDQISIENQKKLLGGIVDLAVANAKSNGGEIDVSGTGKAIGLAFAEGNLGRLVKQNVAGISESQKALFAVGTEAERTAILMKVLDDNAKGAGEALGASFQGKINRANDAIEKLQVSVGQGLVMSMNILGVEATEATAGLGGMEIAGRRLNQLMVGLSLIFSLFGKVLVGTGRSLVSGGKVFLVFGEAGISAITDIYNAFKEKAKSIGAIISGLGKAITGDFTGASDSFKQAFSFQTGVNFTSTRAKLAQDLKAIGDANEKANALERESIGNTITRLTNFKETYNKTEQATKDLTAAKDSQAKAETKVKEATEASKKATEDAKKQLQDFTKQLVETTQQSQKTSKELGENLSKAFKDFGKSVSDNIKETSDKLAQIFVDAEEKKKVLLAKSDKTTSDEEELKKLEATIQARVGFEERAAKQIADIKEKLSKAGLDPNSLSLDTGDTFSDQVKQARLDATLSEFTLFENEQNKKIISITNNFITETLLIKNKIDTQKRFEDELTAFLISENSKRTKDIESFAQNAIQKYGEMASSLRSVISLQAQAGALRSSGVQQFSAGGFVGPRGGEVHAGEFVVPAHLVNANPELMSMLETARNQTNNITINQSGVGTTNTRGFMDEMLWRLSRK